MLNLLTRIVTMETVWRQGGESYFLWGFYGKISPQIVCSFYGENMVSQITRQSPYLFYHKISIKSIALHTVSILSTHCLHILWQN